MLKNYSKITIFLFLLFLFLGFITTLTISNFLSKSRVPGLSTKAFYYQGVAMTCENNCAPPNDWCNPNATSDSCCQEIKRTGDPLACPWPQRGYCKDDECASIPSGTDRQRCGAPRHHWCDLCRGSCCVNADGSINHIPEIPPPSFTNGCPSTIVWAPGYAPNPTQTPSQSPTAKPTKTPTPRPNVPTPTAFSTPIPTATTVPYNYPTPTTPQPTSYSPTTIIPFLPTEAPQPSISQTPIGLPSFNLNLPNVNIAIQKPLDIFEFIFNRIVFYDRLLENKINQKIQNFIPRR